MQQPKNFVRITFKRWLKLNAYRFMNAPRITGKHKNDFHFKLSGITKQFVVSIHHGIAFDI